MKPPYKNFGKPVELNSLKGQVNPNFDLPDFMDKMANIELILKGASHQILLDGRNRISVVPFLFSEGKTIEIVVKEFSTRRFHKMKTILLPSKAKRAWWAGVALMEQNIPTPEPVAYFESARSPFIQKSCYLAVLEKGVEEIRYLFRRLSSKDLLLLIQKLAPFLRLCHTKGFLHQDLSDGNILVRRGLQKEYTFFLIDTNRIRLKKRLSRMQKIKSLIRLGVPREYQRRFLETYSGSGGLKKWEWVWYRVCKNTYTWRIDLKKRLFFRDESKTRNSA